MLRPAPLAALLTSCLASYLATSLAPCLAAAPQWTRVTTPNVELYTTAGEKAGRDAALHFEQIRAFFAQASPVKPPGDFPLRIIAFSSSAEYRLYTSNPRSAAFFVSGPGRDYIVMQDASPESSSIAVHEYVHFVIRHSGLHVPLWLSEGWADVYSSMRRVRDGMAVGDLVPLRMRALDSAKGGWFDFQTLTSVAPGSSIYNEGDRTGLFYAESWAVAHMLFLSPEYRDNFGKFLIALHRGTAAGDAVQAAFGKTGDQLFADAQRYFDRKKLVGTVFKTTPLLAHDGSTASEPVAASLDEYNSRLILADLQVAAGRSDLARIEYERLESQNPDRKDLQQSMGYLFWGIRDNAKSREHLARAFSLGASDPQACYTLALLQLAAGDPAQQIIASLERAVAGYPGFTDALLQLGVIRSITRQFEAAKQALLAIPAITADKAAGVYYALATAYLETGDLDTARTHLATARKYIKKKEEVALSEALSTLLEARAKSAFAPHPGENVIRVEGQIQAIACGPQGQKMQFRPATGAGMVADTLLLDLPAKDSVEIIHRGPGELQLQCGPITSPRVAIEYAVASAVRQGSAGVLRALQF